MKVMKGRTVIQLQAGDDFSKKFQTHNNKLNSKKLNSGNTTGLSNATSNGLGLKFKLSRSEKCFTLLALRCLFSIYEL